MSGCSNKLVRIHWCPPSLDPSMRERNYREKVLDAELFFDVFSVYYLAGISQME